MLKETWESTQDTKEDVLSYVMLMRERLEKMASLVQDQYGQSTRPTKALVRQNCRQTSVPASRAGFSLTSHIHLQVDSTMAGALPGHQGYGKSELQSRYEGPEETPSNLPRQNATEVACTHQYRVPGPRECRRI